MDITPKQSKLKIERGSYISHNPDVHDVVFLSSDISKFRWKVEHRKAKSNYILHYFNGQYLICLRCNSWPANIFRSSPYFCVLLRDIAAAYIDVVALTLIA